MSPFGGEADISQRRGLWRRQQISQMLALSGRHRKNFNPRPSDRVFPELRAPPWPVA